MRQRPAPILFDLDGTLADTIGDITASTNHTRARHGLPPLSADAVRGMVGDGAAALLRRALADLGLEQADPRWREIYGVYAAHHEQQCTVTATLYPEVRPQLEARRAEGHPLAVVTNKPERFARRIVDHLDLAGLLPVVVGGDTLPRRKPDPAPVRWALAQLGDGAAGSAGGAGVGAAGTMVGDGETDLRAGRAAGLRTIGCLYGYRPAAALRAAGADLYWTRFGERW